MLGLKAVLSCPAESSGPKEQSFAHVHVDTHTKHIKESKFLNQGHNTAHGGGPGGTEAPSVSSLLCLQLGVCLKPGVAQARHTGPRTPRRQIPDSKQ